MRAHRIRKHGFLMFPTLRSGLRDLLIGLCVLLTAVTLVKHQSRNANEVDAAQVSITQVSPGLLQTQILNLMGRAR